MDWSNIAKQTYKAIQKQKIKKAQLKDKEFNAYMAREVSKCMDLPRYGKRRGQP
ncbi:hypothetical protein [Clostridium ihumii]|uniref:hypothetical protein n=1 Tax=Clostridium ihumii TaxID=1470356 RepID=UPI000A43B37F|nr:hypothetical protein [Clostridium ihumii]